MINTLKVDGTTEKKDLADVNYVHGNVRVGNVYFLGREFKFKDIFSDRRVVYGFYITFKQLGNEKYGNESVMSILVDF